MNDWDMTEIINEIMSYPDALGMDEGDIDESDVAEWYPEEYVIMFNGFRGSGKSLGVCWFGSWHLKYREDVAVYTDLDYNFENLERDGFKNLPITLDWDELISFRLAQPPGSMNQIDEVDTKLDKLRTNTNQNLVATKFLEQIRKRSLKFVLSCQFGHYLPYGTLDQVDMMIHCHDLFFTPSGRENGLKKGERFLFVAQDKSGFFTGGRQQVPICFMLDGKGIWDYYATDKLHDTLQFAKKYKFEGGEQLVNMSTGESYPSEEARAHDEERKIRQFRDTVGLVWGSQFMGWMQANAERLNISESGNCISVTKKQIEKALSNVKPNQRRVLNKAYTQLLVLSDQGGVVSQRNGGIIDIMKPNEVMRDGEEIIPTPGLTQNEQLWA